MHAINVRDIARLLSIKMGAFADMTAADTVGPTMATAWTAALEVRPGIIQIIWSFYHAYEVLRSNLWSFTPNDVDDTGPYSEAAAVLADTHAVDAAGKVTEAAAAAVTAECAHARAAVAAITWRDAGVLRDDEQRKAAWNVDKTAYLLTLTSEKQDEYDAKPSPRDFPSTWDDESVASTATAVLIKHGENVEAVQVALDAKNAADAAANAADAVEDTKRTAVNVAEAAARSFADTVLCTVGMDFESTPESLRNNDNNARLVAYNAKAVHRDVPVPAMLADLATCTVE